MGKERQGSKDDPKQQVKGIDKKSGIQSKQAMTEAPDSKELGLEKISNVLGRPNQPTRFIHFPRRLVFRRYLTLSVFLGDAQYFSLRGARILLCFLLGEHVHHRVQTFTPLIVTQGGS